MKTKVRKIGNSYGILLFKRILEQAKVKDEVFLSIENNKIIIEPAKGMSHYDAILLFNELYEKYNISFPKDFNVNQYFYTEGYELPNFIRKILRMSSKTKISIKNVTVGHIMKVILKQKWTEPDS